LFDPPRGSGEAFEKLAVKSPRERYSWTRSVSKWVQGYAGYDDRLRILVGISQGSHDKEA
jgi:hypothetical protein